MNKLRSAAGISTLEVVVALALFAITAAGLAATTINVTNQTARSKIATAANALVEDLMEQLRALDPATKPWQLQAGTYNDPNNPITAGGVSGGKFMRSWTVTPDTPGLGLARVEVRVVFSGPANFTALGVTYLCTTATCS
ncbi:MAG: type II secretion system GspH family protein [Candidatus Binatia bacterium]|nr:type II secretion system GspH family protein [Candidatus Binatia bacterium]